MNIQTAEELGNKHGMTDKQKLAMIEFAKLHVKQALEAANNTVVRDKYSILNCYPENLIL